MKRETQNHHPAYVIMRSLRLSLLLMLTLFPGGALSSSLLHPNGCFVTQCKSNQLSSSRKSRTVQIAKRTTLKQQESMVKMWGVTPSNNNNNQGENNNNGNTTPNYNQQQQQLIPILMYTIVPFLPSITIQTFNDQYQQFKQQFNVAAASLPPNAATDSIEYITASNMYNTSMQSLLVLLLSKRVALYFLATMATLYAGWRASVTIGMIEGGYLGGPGMALDYLNREVLKGEKTFAIVGTAADDDENVGLSSDKDEKQGSDDDDEKLFATLVDDSAQSTNVGSAIALILPLLLGASLALSYSLISFFKDGSSDGSSLPSSIIGDEYWNAIQGMLPYLTSIPSMALCILFVATEFRSVSTKASSTNTTPLLRAENIAALLYVAGAYIAKIYPTVTIGEWNLDLAPLQNGVNIAFAATVVRALSPFLISYTSTLDSSSTATSPTVPSISIRTMALALIGVTLFDGISVFGTVANAATIDTVVAPTSVMETVATYKADAQLWNPGLLSVVVGHSQKARITEALGLGDVVFPACLVAWSFYVDSLSETTDDSDVDEMPKKQISYTTATTAGYVIGSAATEIVGTFSLLGGGRGLPALIFLIPSMLLAVTTVAWSRGELNEVWGASSGVAESNTSD